MIPSRMAAEQHQIASTQHNIKPTMNSESPFASAFNSEEFGRFLSKEIPKDFPTSSFLSKDSLPSIGSSVFKSKDAFSSLFSSKDWELKLPKEESQMAIAVEEELVFFSMDSKK